MKDLIYLGPCPADETCVGVDDPAYEALGPLQCLRWIKLLRSTFGPEPDGARLFVKANPHDLGTYHEVVCEFDDDRAAYPLAMDYALRCDWEQPPTWTTGQ